MNYQRKGKYFDAVKKIKDRVEYAYELSLRDRGSAGDIFGLKNFRWTHRQEIVQKTEHSGGITVKIQKFVESHRGRRRRATVRAVTRRCFRTWLKLRVVPDAFEQELLTDIAEAEAIGQDELAAEWRLELNTYRAAKKQAILEEQAGGGSSAVARPEALGKRRLDQP